MKLLFDQNISFRIVRKIQDEFPQTCQVRQVGLENVKDIQIWEYAKENDFVIVTFDADFYDFALVKGIPPKIIWLRTGNTTTQNIEKILRDKKEMIQEFIESDDYKQVACLEIIES